MKEKKRHKVFKVGKDAVRFGKKMIVIGGIYSVLGPGLILAWIRYNRAHHRACKKNK